eukprot:4290737-Pleurochrysis_carterae.AAC.10
MYSFKKAVRQGRLGADSLSGVKPLKLPYLVMRKLSIERPSGETAETKASPAASSRIVGRTSIFPARWELRLAPAWIPGPRMRNGTWMSVSYLQEATSWIRTLQRSFRMCKV